MSKQVCESFESLLTRAEAGQQIASQSFSTGYAAIWYKSPDGTQFQVQYDAQTWVATSVQIVGKEQVFFPA